MKTLSLIFLLIISNPTTLSQWGSPRAVDTAAVFSSEGRVPIGIGVGQQGELAIVPWRVDTLVCYFSTDNGRTFTRSVIDHAWNFYYSGENIGPVEGVGFDHRSNIFVLWRKYAYDDLVGWYSFRISKSTDGGRAFFSYWATRYFGGTSTSSLLKAALFIDAKNRLHCVWDSVDYSGYKYVYTELSASDSSIKMQTRLPTVAASGSPASMDVCTEENVVHAALSARKPGEARSALYYFRSTDSGRTFSLTLAVDTLNARNPRLLRRASGGFLLVHTSGSLAPGASYNDTAIVARSIMDSSVSQPLLLAEQSGYASNPIDAQKHDSTIYIAYTRFQPVYGVSFYQTNEFGGTPLDSLFLPGHHSPALAIDSLGGKYLVSVFQNRIYLSTKDIVVDVEQNREGIPNAFHLDQNYPNPFNPTTTIEFDLPRRSHVSLVVYDILGRKVTSLTNGIRDAGRHSVLFDATSLSSGVYFYRLIAGGYVQTRKMIVQK
jgi:hypothetical protein